MTPVIRQKISYALRATMAGPERDISDQFLQGPYVISILTVIFWLFAPVRIRAQEASDADIADVGEFMLEEQYSSKAWFRVQAGCGSVL